MLDVTARALRWLDTEVVRRINEGQWQEQILDEVELPPEFDESEHLQPLYGCTQFAVRDVLRRYMGWYDGNPSMVFPSTRAQIATEVVGLIGGVDALLARADALAAGDAADQQLALHLVDYVIFNEGEGLAEAHRRKADLLESRAAGERSFVAHNVLKSAAAIEREALGE
jgi:alkyl sulfatase BDS1-like metallo-beta-lactamase superfamily hydrolase